MKKILITLLSFSLFAMVLSAEPVAAAQTINLVQGSITAFVAPSASAAGSLSIKGMDGATVAYVLKQSSKIVDRNLAALTVAQLKNGQNVLVSFQASDKLVIDIAVISAINTTTVGSAAAGTVVTYAAAVAPANGKITLKGTDGKTSVYEVAKTTKLVNSDLSAATKAIAANGKLIVVYGVVDGKNVASFVVVL